MIGPAPADPPRYLPTNDLAVSASVRDAATCQAERSWPMTMIMSPCSVAARNRRIST